MSIKSGFQGKSNILKGVLSLFIKQLIGGIICLALVLGMKYSHSNKLNSYAKSLGVALRFNPQWEDTVKEAFYNIRSNKDEGLFK